MLVILSHGPPRLGRPGRPDAGAETQSGWVRGETLPRGSVHPFPPGQQGRAGPGMDASDCVRPGGCGGGRHGPGRPGRPRRGRGGGGRAGGARRVTNKVRLEGVGEGPRPAPPGGQQGRRECCERCERRHCRHKHNTSGAASWASCPESGRPAPPSRREENSSRGGGQRGQRCEGSQGRAAGFRTMDAAIGGGSEGPDRTGTRPHGARCDSALHKVAWPVGAGGGRAAASAEAQPRRSPQQATGQATRPLDGDAAGCGPRSGRSGIGSDRLAGRRCGRVFSARWHCCRDVPYARTLCSAVPRCAPLYSARSWAPE